MIARSNKISIIYCLIQLYFIFLSSFSHGLNINISSSRNKLQFSSQLKQTSHLINRNNLILLGSYESDLLSISTTSKDIDTYPNRVSMIMDHIHKLVDMIGSSAKAIVITFVSILVVTSSTSWLPIYYALMTFASSTMSKSLKLTIRQPRPVGSPEGGYGMPSSHSQAFFFLFTAVTLKFLILESNKSIIAMILCPLLGLYCLMASYWRVKTKLHSVSQTVVGALFGSSIAYISVQSEKKLLHKMSRLLGGEDEYVPWKLRLILVIIGSLVLHYPEIKDNLQHKKDTIFKIS